MPLPARSRTKIRLGKVTYHCAVGTPVTQASQLRCDNGVVPERDDLRQFIRDIARRHERIWQEQSAMLREQSEALRVITTELRDTRDERRAHTQALLRLIDRLENGGAQA